MPPAATTATGNCINEDCFPAQISTTAEKNDSPNVTFCIARSAGCRTCGNEERGGNRSGVAAALAALSAYDIYARCQSVLGVPGRTHMQSKSRVARARCKSTRQTPHTLYHVHDGDACGMQLGDSPVWRHLNLRDEKDFPVRKKKKRRFTPTAQTNRRAPLAAIMSMSSGNSPLV